MIILGIETSCDETAAAIVEDGKKILSSVVTSSESLQKQFGGIIPEQAAREQLKVILPVIAQSLHEAFSEEKDGTLKQCDNLAMENIDAIAVTFGPGLIGSLMVGVEAAKTLSLVFNKPLIPVNHLLGHIYANFLNTNTPDSCLNRQHIKHLRGGLKQKHQDSSEVTIQFPAICLVVSGGHTDLLLMQANHTFKLLGSTRDDAAGECFDKTARMLGLSYPGGPEIEKAASLLKANSYKLKARIKLPRPMIHDNNFDFSFSGLKTAVLTLAKESGLDSDLKQNKNERVRPSSKQLINQVAYEIQEAITDVLVTKTLKAAEKFPVKSILVSGGVAANSRLREKFKKAMKQCNNVTMKLFIPDKKLCTDNAAVIAATAFYQNQPLDWRNLKPNPSLHF